MCIPYASHEQRNAKKRSVGAGAPSVSACSTKLTTGVLPDSVQSSSVRRRAGLPMLMREV